MISRPLLWFIALAVAVLLALAWWGSRYPARVTIINVSGGALREVEIRSGDQRVAAGTIANGRTRSVALEPGDTVVVHFGRTTWRSAEELTPARSMVLYVGPGGRVEERSRLGTLGR
ncbi:MAG: hypothetical protein AABO58_16450 [Acidobacteriota bacterium]